MACLSDAAPSLMIDCRNVAPSYNLNQSFKTHYMKKRLTFILFGSLFLLPAFSVKAQSGDSPVKAEPALIRYLGTQEDMAIFNISYLNPAGGAFDLAVRDQDGIELYKHTFHQKNFSKQFRLPKTEKSKLSFILRNGKEAELVKTFEINGSSRSVQYVAVKKPD